MLAFPGYAAMIEGMNEKPRTIQALQSKIQALESEITQARNDLERLQKDPCVVHNSEFSTERGDVHFKIHAKGHWNSCTLMLNKNEAKEMANALNAFLSNPY